MPVPGNGPFHSGFKPRLSIRPAKPPPDSKSLLSDSFIVPRAFAHLTPSPIYVPIRRRRRERCQHQHGDSLSSPSARDPYAKHLGKITPSHRDEEKVPRRRKGADEEKVPATNGTSRRRKLNHDNSLHRIPRPPIGLGRNRAKSVSPRMSQYHADRYLTPQFTSLLSHLTYSFGKCHSWLTPFLVFSLSTV